MAPTLNCIDSDLVAEARAASKSRFTLLSVAAVILTILTADSQTGWSQSVSPAKRPMYTYASPSLRSEVRYTLEPGTDYLLFASSADSDWYGVATADSFFIGYTLRTLFGGVQGELVTYEEWGGARIGASIPSELLVGQLTDLIPGTARAVLPLYGEKGSGGTPIAQLQEGDAFLAFDGGRDWVVVASVDTVVLGYVPSQLMPQSVGLPQYSAWVEAYAEAAFVSQHMILRHHNLTAFRKNIFGDIDANVTRVRPSGQTNYKVGSFVTEDFEQAFSRLSKPGESTYRSLPEGAPVVIDKVKLKRNALEVTFLSESDQPLVVEIEIEMERPLSPRDIRTLIARAFRTEGASAEPTIELGMSISDVIAIMGEPDARVNLGSRTILTISGLKLVFQDGLLADVQ